MTKAEGWLRREGERRCRVLFDNIATDHARSGSYRTCEKFSVSGNSKMEGAFPGAV